MRLTRWLVVGIMVLVGLGLMVGPRPASAASGKDVAPLTGQWCGMTDDGGSVRLEVTSDSNFVRNVDIRTFSGAVSFPEGTTQPGAQIKSAQFIIRGTTDVQQCERRALPPQPGVPGGPGRCERAPCSQPPSRPGEVCRTVTVETLQIRGMFAGIDSLSGTFTFPVGTRRIYGQYTAWPASIATCP